MFCPNCGSNIPDASASFCPNCGAKLNSFAQDSTQSSAQQNFQQDSQQDSRQDSQQSWYNQFNYTPPQQDSTPYASAEKYNGLSIAGFSVSCAAIIFNIFLVGLPGVVGLILSIIGLNQCNDRSEKGRGLAIAGIAIGAILTLLMILMYASCAAAIDSVWNSGFSEFLYY